MTLSHTTVELFRRAISGLLVVFGIHILFEIGWQPILGVALVLIAAGWFLAKKTARHFGHHHHHGGDSAIDAIPALVLFFANVLHPAVDGFTVVETFRIGGIISGVLLGLSVVLHEILRQSAFVTALNRFHIRWGWVVGTACIGILLGIYTALRGANFFHRYEIVADLATLFSYSFVIAEFYVIEEHKSLRYKHWLFVGGVVLGLIIVLVI